MTTKMRISICTFNNGSYDVMIIDAETGKEVCLSGTQKLSELEAATVNKLAPACVWTAYTMDDGQ